MTEPTDDPRLIDLAAAVSDDATVDWKAAEDSLDDDHDKSLLRELKLLAAVGTVARAGDPLPPEGGDIHTPVLPGSDTWGHLRLEEVIGRGSFGTVYKAWDPTLEKHVALKLLHPRTPPAAADSQRAIEEARLLARVNHENVVRVLGVETHDGRVGLWMELVSGRTLEDILQAQGPLSADEARQVGAAVCRALAAVHKAGVVHQDLKAHNVMREDGGRMVVMDLGQGLRTTPAASSDVMGIGGTPLYLAPELFTGQPSSPASDIYSLGVLLFHLVTGGYPVDGENRLEIERAHTRGQRARLRDARPDLPAEFVQLVERALSSDPRDRFQSAGDFETALNGRASTTPKSSMWVLAAGTLLAASVVMALVLWLPSTGPVQVTTAAPPPDAANPNASGPDRATRNSASATTIVPSEATTESVTAPYQVQAAFFRKGPTGKEPLSAGSRLALEDTIALELNTSSPVYVYVLNQDEKGNAHLLYPLDDDLAHVRPVSAGVTRIPAANAFDGWVVNSPGQREHFLVAVSPTRLTEFEREVGNLPRPRVGAPIMAVPLPDRALGTLRGIGGLAPTPARGPNPLAPFLGATLLTDSEETALGPWLRRITFENP